MRARRKQELVHIAFKEPQIGRQRRHLSPQAAKCRQASTRKQGGCSRVRAMRKKAPSNSRKGERSTAVCSCRHKHDICDRGMERALSCLLTPEIKRISLLATLTTSFSSQAQQKPHSPTEQHFEGSNAQTGLASIPTHTSLPSFEKPLQRRGISARDSYPPEVLHSLITYKFTA